MNRFRAFLILAAIAIVTATGVWVTSRSEADERAIFVPADPSSPPGHSDTSAEEIKDETKDRYVPKSQVELRRSLSRIAYDVTQNEATEPAFRNKYWNNKQKGIYTCVVCDRTLFSSDTKYKSGTGWPSFFAPIDPDHVGYKTDNHLFYSRTEVHCSRCGAHLGHVFDDGPRPTGRRYCMNSASMKFSEKKTPDAASDASAALSQSDAEDASSGE